MLGKDGVLGEGKPRFRVEGCPSPKETSWGWIQKSHPVKLLDGIYFSIPAYEAEMRVCLLLGNVILYCPTSRDIRP